MEKVVAENLCKEDFNAAFRECFQVYILPVQLGYITDLYPVYTFHHHDFGTAPGPVHFRHIKQIGVTEIAPQLRGIGGLAQQVEFVVKDLFKFSNDFTWSQAATMLPVPLCQSCKRVQQVQVTRNLLADIGAQHLDDDISAILELCSVYLCDGGGCQRGFVELTKDFFNRGTQRGLDCGACPGAGKRRYVILQACQFLSDIIWQQIPAC